MRKPDFCLYENCNCIADLCFRYTDSTIPLLHKSKIQAKLLPFSMTLVGNPEDRFFVASRLTWCLGLDSEFNRNNSLSVCPYSEHVESAGAKDIKLFSYSIQLRLSIHVDIEIAQKKLNFGSKAPIPVGILTCVSRIYFSLSLAEHEKVL